jgi:REP element-mobilizing transposase RayT
MFEDLYGKGDDLTVVVKGRKEIFNGETIDDKLDNVARQASSLGKQIDRWRDVPEHIKGTWVSDDL